MGGTGCDETKKEHVPWTGQLSTTRWAPVGSSLQDVHDIRGIRHQKSRNRPLTPEEKRALEILNSWTKYDMYEDKNIFHDPGYEIPLPWKDGEPQLEDNREQATHKLNSMFRRFEKDPTYKEAYCNAIQKYLEMGVYKRTLKKWKQWYSIRQRFSK